MYITTVPVCDVWYILACEFIFAKMKLLSSGLFMHQAFRSCHQLVETKIAMQIIGRLEFGYGHKP